MKFTWKKLIWILCEAWCEIHMKFNMWNSCEVKFVWIFSFGNFDVNFTWNWFEFHVRCDCLSTVLSHIIKWYLLSLLLSWCFKSSDGRLNIQTKPLDVVYNPMSVKRVREFFSTKKLSSSRLSQLKLTGKNRSSQEFCLSHFLNSNVCAEWSSNASNSKVVSYYL